MKMQENWSFRMYLQQTYVKFTEIETFDKLLRVRKP